MLRENIDLNRDVSNLVDPMVQGYIYASGLYLREPEYKPLVDGKVIAFEHVQTPDDALLTEIHSAILGRFEYADAVLDALVHSGDELILLRNQLWLNHLTGFIRYRYMAPESLYEVLGDLELADQVRRNTSGKILLISGLTPPRTSSSPIRRSFCSQRCSPKPARLAAATPCSSHRKTCRVNTSWAL